MIGFADQNHQKHTENKLKVHVKKIIASLVFTASLNAFAADEVHPLYVGSVSVNPSQDAKILADWYTKIGLETHEVGGGYYGTFNTPGGAFFFGIHPKRKSAPATSSGSVSVVFRIDDYDHYLAEVKKRGLTPDSVEQDTQGHFAHFKDPDGNEVTLWGK
jgi:predicted enzyme related to lactoylglutathione lyase